MRAAVVEQQGRPLVLRDDLSIREPKAGELLVRVRYCGLCHSDLSLADGVFPCPLPIVLGHEAAGVVEAVGPEAGDVKPGDAVLLTAAPPCGSCYACVRGEPGVCVNARGIQTHSLPDGDTGLSLDGKPVYRGVGLAAFAEKVLVPRSGAVRVPPDTPLDVACVIGCAVQTGVGAVFNTARVPPGATVLVIGLGAIGLSAVQGARIAGASRIIASDPIGARRERAQALGATDLIDPLREDLGTRVMELTERGVDFAFECVGRADLVRAAIWATRPGGTTVAVGAAPLEDKLVIEPLALFTLDEKKLLGCALGSCNALRDIPRLLDLWRVGRLDLEGLISARRPLSEINEAMQDMREGRGIRTVFEVS